MNYFAEQKYRVKIKALEECYKTLESACFEQQAETKAAEKKAKESERKLNRLINLVENNVRNPETILNQLGK